MQNLPQHIPYETEQEFQQKLLLHKKSPSAWELILRHNNHNNGWIMSEQELLAWLKSQPLNIQQHIHRKRKIFTKKMIDFAGITKDSPLIIGVIEHMCDSFTTSSDNLKHQRLMSKAMQLMAEKADILELCVNTSENISPAQELKQNLPLIEELLAAGAIISVTAQDTQRLQAYIDAGVQIINDVRVKDAEILNILHKNPHISVVLMQEEQQNLPLHHNMLLNLYDALFTRIQILKKAGITKERIAIDPWIGFKKSLQDNLDVMGRLSLLRSFDCPIMVGASRKDFITMISNDAPMAERDAGSIAAALWAVGQGAKMLRVHNVKATKQALDVYMAIEKSSY